MDGSSGLDEIRRLRRELAAYKEAVSEASSYAVTAKVLIEKRVAELLAANTRSVPPADAGRHE